MDASLSLRENTQFAREDARPCVLGQTCFPKSPMVSGLRMNGAWDLGTEDGVGSEPGAGGLTEEHSLPRLLPQQP